MDDSKNDQKIVLEDEDENIIYKSTTTTNDYIKNKGPERYKHELQHLLPFRSKKRDPKDMPIDSASCFQFVYFEWMTPLVWRSFRTGLKPTDLYHCSKTDSNHINSLRMANLWEDECNSKGLHNASLQTVIHRFIKTRLLITSGFYLICLLMGYLSSTLFLKKLLDYIEDESASTNDGVRWMVALFLCELFRASTFAIMYAISIRTAIRTASALNGLLYNKLLTSRPPNKAVGEVVNLFANDSDKVLKMVNTLPLILGGPIVIVVTIAYTTWLLGPLALVGIVVLILIYCLQILISKKQSLYRKKLVLKSDKRISSTTELLTYIKLIKLYAWEQIFSQYVFEFRETEKQLLEKCQYLQCLSTSLSLMAPLVITIVTILAYTLAKQGDLTAAKAFTLVMVYYVAAHGIRMLPIYLQDLQYGRRSLKRIEKLLQYDDKDNYLMLTTNPSNSVEFKGATLAWDTYSPEKALKNENSSNKEGVIQRSSTLTSTALFDLNLDIPNAQHIGIVGSIGSGKTALLCSLLGQMKLSSGKVCIRGSIAYVSQQPWILNASVRDNIVFGYNFDKKRFYETISCCALTNDISSLPEAELTQIGERGVTISGGQKQRISLARAYFANKDIYLLDDPLSAVDRNVGQHIFNQCIKGGLKNKTVLMVSHQIEYLENMDLVVFLRDGNIVNSGVHNDLYNSDEEYRQLIESSKIDVNISDSQRPPKTEDDTIPDFRFSSPDWSDVKPLPLNQSQSESSSTSQIIDLEFRGTLDSGDTLTSSPLIFEEKMGTGNISMNTYKAYIRAGGGFFILSFVIGWLLFQAIASTFSNWWLGYWIAQGNGNTSYSGTNRSEREDTIIDNPDLKYYQTIYGLSIAAIICSTLAFGYMFTKVTLSASSYLHNQIFQKVCKSPMAFFDTIPIGRIINLFTRDMDEMDTYVPQALDGFLQRLMIVICNLFIIILVFPWFLLPFSALMVLFWLIHNMFRGAMRDLKRMESKLRSPVYSHITETIDGLSTIKAFNKQKEFRNKFSELVDNHSAPNFLYFCSMRWLSTRMDILCVFISLFAAIFAITSKQSIGAAFAGLALVLSMQLSGLLQFLLRLAVDSETRFTSVERIQMYIEGLRPEKDVITQINSQLNDWPTRGRISFRDVTMRYRPGLPLALKDITFDINPQEKIGIVGRTGAGKSSITSVLFRLVEINSGSIHIDGIDISNVPLAELRSRISIIPQDPILFRGSIKKNLDPFGEFTLQVIMDALECVQLKLKVNNLKHGINTTVNERDANFSAGERQLLCMARALLRKTKIVVLDEPTSQMDGETENVIHNTITNIFKNCTVIKIAHRLQTVQDCDRVMVMNDGKIVEFDNPSVLSSNPESFFSKMINSNQSK